jgi:hypothetical protein
MSNLGLIDETQFLTIRDHESFQAELDRHVLSILRAKHKK